MGLLDDVDNYLSPAFPHSAKSLMLEKILRDSRVGVFDNKGKTIVFTE
jgi:hypothetical protein